MGIDYTVYLGPYIECSGPKWLGSENVLDDFIKTELNSSLFTVDPMCGTLLEGKEIFISNKIDFESEISIDPVHSEDLAPIEITSEFPQKCINDLKSFHRQEIELLHNMFREVNVKFGFFKLWPWEGLLRVYDQEMWRSKMQKVTS